MAATDPKATKADAGYTNEGTPDEHCGICASFVLPHRCQLVEPGQTVGAWCSLFSHVGGSAR